MNTSPFWPLVWKEYRTGRAFWLAMAAMGLLAQGGVAWLAHQPADRNWWLYKIALMITAGFAVGIGGTLFAVEHEERTIALLRRLPVRAGQLGAAKVLSAMGGLIALLAVLWLAARAMAGWQALPVDQASELWRQWGLTCLEGLAWGVLWSLAIRHPLRATVAAALTVALVDSCAVGLTSHYEVTATAYAETIPYRTALLLLVVAADTLLLPRWLDGHFPRWQRWRIVTRLTDPAHSRPVVRLAWQTFREGRTSFLLLIVVAPAAFVLLRLLVGRPVEFVLSPRGDQYLFAFLMPLALLAAIDGALVFRADQLHGPRFLAGHGVSPRTIWFSRQLVWGVWLWGLAAIFVGLLLALLCAALVRWTFGLGFFVVGLLNRYGFLSERGLQILLPAYAAGQLASLLMRRGLLAVTLAVVLGGLVAIWVWLMFVIGASWWWSVLPLPIGMLLATWLRMPAWLVERPGWRQWVAPSAAALLPVAVLCVGVPIYRIVQIPAETEICSRPSSSPAAIADARGTLKLYAQAWDLSLVSRDQSPEDDPQKDGSSPLGAIDEVRRQPVVDLVLEASRQDSNLLVLPVAVRRPAATQIEKLGDLLLRFANEQRQTGKLDVALDAYLATLRLQTQLHACNGSRPPIRQETFYGLQTWAATPGQTAERIRAASMRLKVCHAAFPNPSDWLLPEYEETELTIADLAAALQAEIVPQKGFNEGSWLVSRLAWERARAQRLLDWLTAWQLVRARNTEKAISEGRPVRPTRQPDPHTRDWPDVASYYSRLGRWLVTTPLLVYSPLVSQSLARVVFCQETDYRATLIILALEAWKAEHGQLPDRLEELVGSELDALPVDPLYARPFLYYPHGFSGFSDQPFLWSASNQNLEDRKNNSDPKIFMGFGDDVPQPVTLRPDGLPVDKNRFPYSDRFPYDRNDSSGQPVHGPIIDVIRAGHAYPIPQAAEKQP